MPPGMPVLSCSLPAFRTRGLFSMFCTEVSCSVPLRTSVPKACFLLFGRKFRTLYPCWLPYQSPIFCILDGSFMPHVLTDFRTKGTFSVFWTEVSCPAASLTSVSKACFQCFVRKYRVLQSSRLPYQRPVFRVLDGSFMPCSLPGFRTRAPFSAFWTEVSCLICLLTSVPEPRFHHFGRKSIFAITAFYYHISLYFFVFLKIFQNECFFCWVSCVYGSTLFSISLSYLYEYQSDT